MKKLYISSIQGNNTSKIQTFDDLCITENQNKGSVGTD